MLARRKRESDALQSGFTLLEVMMAMLIGAIGLMGTMAVQQAVTAASKNANDASVALRLATQKLDELASRSTDSQAIDTARGLNVLATGQWSAVQNVDSRGNVLATAMTDSNRSAYRWARQWKVLNTGGGAPYVLSAIVSYNNDAGATKTTRLDVERRKNW
jgi:prepilin-type N-terminal cleavage/methylation domain-containing protein